MTCSMSPAIVLVQQKSKAPLSNTTLSSKQLWYVCCLVFSSAAVCYCQSAVVVHTSKVNIDPVAYIHVINFTAAGSVHREMFGLLCRVACEAHHKQHRANCFT